MSNKTLFNTTLADVLKQEADGQAPVTKQTDNGGGPLTRKATKKLRVEKPGVADGVSVAAYGQLPRKCPNCDCVMEKMVLVDKSFMSDIFSLTDDKIDNLLEQNSSLNANHPAPFPESVDGERWNLSKLVYWSGMHKELAIHGARACIEGTVREFKKTLRNRRALLEKHFSINLQDNSEAEKPADAQVDRKFISDTFGVPNELICYKITKCQLPDNHPCKFPKPINRNPDLWLLSEILSWNESAMDFVILQAQNRLEDVVNELEVAWEGRQIAMKQLIGESLQDEDEDSV